MASIFLSYAREDRQYAERLARVLKAAGHEVWWDRHIDSGEEFAAEIEAELDKSDVVLVAWSNLSVKSRWVRDEASVGGETGRLVPVSIDGTPPAMGFRQFHTLDLTGWKGAKRDERTRELLRSIEGRLKGKAAEKEAPAVPAGSRAWKFPFGGANSIWIGAAALVLLAIAAGGFWLWTQRAAQSSEPTKPTMALLPLTAASADPQLREMAAATRDSISNRLSQSGIPVKLLGSAPQDPASAGDYLVSGDFSKDGDKVVATLHVDESAHGVTMSSYQFEAAGDDVRNLTERIGVQMAGTLSGLQILNKRHPADPAQLAQLAQANDAHKDFLERYELAKGLAERATDWRPAQIALAYYTSFILDALPSNQRLAAIAEARRAFDKARELDPGLGEIEGAWCNLHSDALLRDCEDHLRAGIARSPDDTWLNQFLAEFLNKVGRFNEAAQLEQLSYAHDPYAPQKIGHMLMLLEFTGATDDADELFGNGVRWWPDFKVHFLHYRLIGLISRGDFQAIGRFEKQLTWPQYRSSAAIISALNSKSVHSLRAACADVLSDSVDQFFPLRCFVAFNELGDEDSAYALADKLYPRRLGGTPAETEQIWVNDPDGDASLELLSSTATAALRRDPRFLLLAERTGLRAYWSGGRPPDFCRTNPEPICAKLLSRR